MFPYHAYTIMLYLACLAFDIKVYFRKEGVVNH